MREHSRTVGQQLRPVLADGVAHGAVLFVNRPRFFQQRGSKFDRRRSAQRFRLARHPLQGPEQIHGSGTARRQTRARLLQRPGALASERGARPCQERAPRAADREEPRQPRPPRETWSQNPVFQQIDAQFSKAHEENPDYTGLHYMTADEVEECWQLLRQSVHSVSYETLAHVPTYSRWLAPALDRALMKVVRSRR